MLDVWPPFPLMIWDLAPVTEGADDIISVLERRDRVWRIDPRASEVRKFRQ